jgi:type II secretory pathway pseudopilin PulG
MLLGPAGVIIGAASVGLGVGVLQMPEEQRENINQKAAKAIEQAHDTVKTASESLSNSCAVACENTRVGEKYPEVTECCSQVDPQKSNDTGKWDSHPDDFIFGDSNKNNSFDASSAMDEGGGSTIASKPKASRVMDGKKRQTSAFPKINDGNRRVACMRKGE